MSFPVEDAEMQFGETVKVYRRSRTRTGTAVTVQAVTSRGKTPVPTVNIEMAYWPPAEKTPRWGEKISVQVTKSELPVVAAVLAGLRQEMTAQYHGEEKNVGYSVSNFGRVLKVFRPGEALEVELNEHEHYWLLDLVLSRLQACRPTATISDLLNMLKITCSGR